MLLKLTKTVVILVFGLFLLIIGIFLWDPLFWELPDCGDEEIEQEMIERLDKFYVINKDNYVYEEVAKALTKGIELESSKKHRLCEIDVLISYPEAKKPDQKKTLRYKIAAGTGSEDYIYDVGWVGID